LLEIQVRQIPVHICHQIYAKGAVMSDDFISEQSFMDDYRPINLSGDGDMIVQTYAEAELAVQDLALSNRHIWAIVESGDDGSLYASPGYHLVNTIGFVVTENAWQSEVQDAVWHDASEDLDFDEDEDESVSYGPGM